MLHSHDIEIRKALHSKKLKSHHQCDDTLVIDELGMEHGRKRIDIAVLNGKFHGYEIKSSKDNLDRLPDQIEIYMRCVQKLSVVAAENHIEKIQKIAPSECGIILANKGSKGAVHFKSIRRAKLNRNLDFISLSHLLWRNEVIEKLLYCGVKPSLLRKPRNSLYEILEDKISTDDLLKYIKQCFSNRAKWRGH